MELKKIFNKIFRDKKRKVPFPHEAFFLMVDKCNARCSMCQDDYFCHSGNSITLEKFKVMAENIQLEKMNTVVLSGGEPLLNKDLLKIISYINQCYPRINIVISSNGITLTEKISDELVKKNISSLNISLNAGTSDTYKKVMQVDHFEKVVRNIRYYQGLCIKMNKSSHLNLSFVASRKNIEDLLEFIKLAASLGARSASSTYCRFFPMSIRISLDVNKDNLLEDCDSLYFHQQLSDKIFKQAIDLAHHLDVSFTHELLFSEEIVCKKCTFPFTSILIGFDGEVYPCCGGEVIFKQKVKTGKYNFGNVLKKPLNDFWYNKYYNVLRQSVSHPDNPSVPECSRCSNNLKWNGHIRNAHIMDWKELEEKLIDFQLIKEGE